MTIDDFSKLTSDKIAVGDVYPKVEANSWNQAYPSQSNYTNSNHLSAAMSNDYHLPNSYPINTTAGNNNQTATAPITTLPEQASQPKYWS